MFLVSRKLTSYLNFHTEVFPLATPAYSVVMVKPSIYVSDVSNSKVLGNLWVVSLRSRQDCYLAQAEFW